MNIQTLLNTRIQNAMVAAGGPEGSPAIVRQSAKVQFGDYQANGIMGVAKKLKMNPRDFAQNVLEHLDLTDISDKVDIAGPGFINIFLKPEWMAQEILRVLNDARLDVAAGAPATNDCS